MCGGRGGIWLALAAALLHVSLQGEFQRRLYKELVKNYNPLERPVANDSQPLTVYFSLSLLQIMDVSWTDHYLQWNMSEYPGVKNVRFPDGQIWKPDILLYNSADERFDATFHTNVLVNASGHCQYLPPGIFKSSCYIDVRWFPFDVQQCKLKFGSWSYGGWSLDLQMQEADISSYIPNGEWDLMGIPGKRNEKFYECCKEPYPDVTYTVTMRRRTLYYGLNLLIPCVLISALALLVFLLPADSGEKISLGITVLLSLTVFMLLVAEIMPATSDSVPLIDQNHSPELVCMVSAHEEARRGQGAASLSAQASALQPGQCGAECRCWATHQQWQPALHWLPRPGGHALCPNSRLWGRMWPFGLLPNT
ncbi:cholinergic receptor, nicotinic, alpha polypeptide 7, isoform CRA_c [Rattus norvegicus]|uniref:Cholinergic receptor, nicotinic, alpha polypeptide 7, isoform CRA_c n=1 Tax=Rattus norvegicus TaxID=10116 RepID=A6JBJ5_RAT|nr:cholinergic receptor, nicotinic, alpha polypeptide 7, isoform CRA_c [Rattus norvegicus]